MKIRVGHSPDSDDAFMFWALAKGYVKTEYQFEHILKDIQTLNEWAMQGKLETTAVSVHALAYISSRYALLKHGGSFGEGYGPMILSKKKLSKQELEKATIAIPGRLTSAFLALNIYMKDALKGTVFKNIEPNVQVVPFDEIIPAVKVGHYDAGLIIHEGQLTYKEEGLILVEDLGKWWNEATGLPLPLGVNVVRKDLGDSVLAEISSCISQSIRLGLKNRSKALDYALKYARGMNLKTSDEFVGMYVNERTLDMGEDGFQAIKLLLQKGQEIGMLPDVHLHLI